MAVVCIFWKPFHPNLGKFSISFLRSYVFKLANATHKYFWSLCCKQVCEMLFLEGSISSRNLENEALSALLYYLGIAINLISVYFAGEVLIFILSKLGILFISDYLLFSGQGLGVFWERGDKSIKFCNMMQDKYKELIQFYCESAV